ncbi:MULTISPECIES: acyl-CoA dehydrogenase family protein [unclassified Streptomyces]|uniref:Acyl-CoA dehydrogenase family protein n=1 Tax=Streptomyces sp. NBC_00060 TaxID=2975636 RepID=A0AAU2H0W9_9ACTN
MDFTFPPEDDTFRHHARAWLDAHPPDRAPRQWERTLGDGGWIGLGWGETPYGNRTGSLTQQVVWAEEYARTPNTPPRLGHIGENLLAPTLLAHGTPAQKDRFLPGIACGEAIWCQGYSEPGAGSDLAAVRTSATRDSTGAYRLSGQKIWTSYAHEADWCFVLARTESGSHRHHGLSLLLVPMDQPGGRVEVRPIRQLTGTSEFNEVFFDGARADPDHLVGGEGNGWRVAMDLLAAERGVSTLAQQIGFEAELERVIRRAESGAEGGTIDPLLRDRIVRQWAELRTMRWNALRTLGGGDPAAPSVAKLLWGGWHQRLGELAMAVRGAAGAVGPYDWSEERPYELDAFQRLFLFSRADTIYGGSDEIQRTIIAERVLGLPREARGQ